jgi:hypothetical protein
MTHEQKNEIRDRLSSLVNQLGGQRAAGIKAGVSAATVSQILNGRWDLIADGLWRKIAAAIGMGMDGWKLVPGTFNSRVLDQVLFDAKENSMMMCVSYKAGSGKTAGARIFLDRLDGEQVYYIHCREWSVKQFLRQLCRTLGIDMPKGHATADDLLAEVAEFFLLRSAQRPLLIVDEADKLQRAALRVFIPLFNATEDRLGIVLLGTENLSEEIKRGVTYKKKGFDEIDSRLGRNYVRLYGVTQEDMRSICEANGISERATQDEIWKECEPKEVALGGRFVKMLDDLRRLKRAVQRENIKRAAQQQQAAEAATV